MLTTSNSPLSNTGQTVISEAIIDEILVPGHQWRIRFRGSFWVAESLVVNNFLPGDRVEVVARQGLKLIIEPL